MASKAISPLDYVTRAVSKDESRYNMQSAYRDGKRLVATDGHRLHLVDGLDGDTKGFLNPEIDGEFVNYETVMPKKGSLIARLRIDEKQKKQLASLVKTIKERTAAVIMESNVSEGTVTLTRTFEPACESVEGGFYVVFRGVEDLKPFKVGINLRYFVDALLEGVFAEFTVQTEAPDPNYTKTPLVLKYDLGKLSYSAIIMPVRLD